MYYPEELIEEIRRRSDIVDIISGYVHLQKKGSSYFGLCPFHNEKSPSFSVSGQKQMYYCFGCGAGGNVITFLMEYEHMTFPEAVKHLADRAGVNLPEAEYTPEMKAKESRRHKLLEINKEAAKYYYYMLRSKEGELGYRYLSQRELTDETMKRFGLGFSSKYSNDLTRYLKQKGYSESLIRDAGLCVIDEKHGAHDKFWNRVMFPIQDINHRVIAFGGRVLGEGKPKYLNSSETEIFDKSRNLYGLNFARTSRSGQLILCEGYLDVISMHQAGFTQAVASLGTAFTSGHASLVKRYTKDVYLAYDSDGAGVSAALRAIGILRENGMSGRIINLKPYKDPDELIKNLGKEEFQKRIDEAENSFLFEIRVMEKDYDLGDPEGKTRFYQAIAGKLCRFSEELERENYLEAIAEKYHIGYENLRSLVRSMAEKTGLAKEVTIVKPKSGKQNKMNPHDGAKKAQKLLITWLTEQPDLYQQVKKYLTPNDFIDEVYHKAVERLFQDLDEGEVNPAAVISLFAEEDEQREVAALFHTKLPELTDEREKEKAFRDILLSVKRYSYTYDSERMGSDIAALNRVIEGKKALQELEKLQLHV